MPFDQVKERPAEAPAAPASYTSAMKGTILAHAPTEGEAESLRVAIKLAEASNGVVNVVVAEGFEPAAFSGVEFTAGSLMQALLDAQRRRILAATRRAETEKNAAHAPVNIFHEEEFPEDALALHACGADWIVTVRPEHPGAAHAIHADASAVLLRTGMPLLLAPRDAAPLTARRVVIGWRDSREARRAVSDAMPLLMAAEDVLVVAVGPEDRVDQDRAALEQVVARLKLRGCKARCELHLLDSRRDVPSVLNERAESIGADLIVTGAYAHSRAGEWVFGGVTRGLVEHCPKYLLMSH